MGFLSKLFHSLRAREEDEDTIFQQQQQLSNINNNNNGNISRHNHHHKHNNKSSTSTTNNNGSSSSRRSSLSSTNSNTSSSKKSSFLKRKNSTASSSSSTNKNKNKNNKDKNKDNKNIELNENIHDENNNNTDSSNSSDDDDDDTSSDEYNDEFTNNNLHRYNNGNNINTTTTINNNNNKQRCNNNHLIIDYFKMNIEDLFDLENIEMLCREAEDLNLIEYLTQESVMNELIEYIITYHEVIPKRLEYKLRQEQSLDQSFNNSQLNSNQLNSNQLNNNESVNDDEKVEVDDEKEDNEDNNEEIRKSSDNVLLNNNSRENNELIITNNNDNHYEINNNMNGNHLIENHNNNENYEMNHLNNNENNLNNNENNHCSTPISSEDSFLKNNNHINTTNTTTNELTINISSSPLNGNHILNNNNISNNGNLNNLFTDKEEDLEIMEMATNNNNLNNNNEITNIDIHYYLLQKLNVKYPYIATEILTSTLGQYHILPLIMLPKLEIINTNGTSMDYNDYNNRFSIPNLEGGQNGKFIKNDKLNYLKKKLFSFLDKKPLNSFLVKCFVRVVIAMMKIPHLTSIVMDYIYEMNNNNFENESIILKMVNHIDLSDEISELLLMCLLYEDEEEITTIDGNDNEENKLLNIYLIPDELQKIKNLENLKLKKNIISKLCNLQSESNFSRSVTFILTTIIQYRKPITKKPPIIVEYIINREQLELIVKNTLNIVSNASSFVDNMNFIMNLILYISNNSSKLFHEDNFENIDWKAILVIVMKYLNDFVHLLNDKVAEEVLRKDNSIIYVEQVDVFNDDKAVPPLGIYRLKVIELFVILFKHFDILNVILDFELSSKLLKCEILKELIRLFFQYQSSLLHQMIIRLFIQILEDSTLQEFCNLFLFDYHFVDKLIEVHEKNQMLLKVKKFNASVSGFITNLGKIIGDKNLEPLQSNIKWQQFYQFCFDRTFLERVYRIGNNEQNITVPRSELRRVQEVKEYWRSHLQLK